MDDHREEEQLLHSSSRVTNVQNPQMMEMQSLSASESRRTGDRPPHSSDASSSDDDPQPRPQRVNTKYAHLDEKNRDPKPLSRATKIWILVQLGVPYGIAIIFMGIHLGFFYALDGHAVDGAWISQGLQIAVANILAIVVEMSLLAGIAVAYDQCLWRLFRLKPLKVMMIDKLISLMTSPWNLLLPRIFRYAPLEWLLACTCVLVPIAAVFPPGALNVVFREGVLRTNEMVPTLNLSDYGSGSFSAFNRRSFFNPSDANQRKPLLDAMAASVLATGDPPQLSGPCTSSCSYNVNFEAPAFACNQVFNDSKRSGRIDATLNFYETVFNTSESAPNASPGIPVSRPSLMVSWFPLTNSTDYESTSKRTFTQLKCSMVFATYLLNISYDGGNRKIEKRIMPSDKHIDVPLLFFLEGETFPSVLLRPSSQFTQDFKTAQAFSLIQAAANQLIGTYAWGPRTGVVDPNSPGFGLSVNATTILGSSFIDNSKDDSISTNISAENLQDYLSNVVISAMQFNNIDEPLWLTQNITILRGTNIYSFNAPAQFFGPYGACLLVTLLIYVLGVWSLHQNGVSAGNSFLQQISTVGTSERLREASSGCGAGGHENFSKGLKELELLYGIKQIPIDKNGEVQTKWVMGFGTVHEVRPL